MEEINFNILSNSEIKIKLIELENDYEATKNKIRDLVEKMNNLDKAYTTGKTLLDKRTKGVTL